MTFIGLATVFAAWTLAGLGFWIAMTGLVGRRFTARPRQAKVGPGSSN
jgi:hypothetical protein